VAKTRRRTARRRTTRKKPIARKRSIRRKKAKIRIPAKRRALSNTRPKRKRRRSRASSSTTRVTRRKRSKKRRRNPRGGRRRRITSLRRKRRTTKRRRSPRRRKAAAKRRRSPRRKRRARSNPGYRLNGRKRKRRKSRKSRRNPGPKLGLKQKLNSFLKGSWVTPAVHGLIGVSAAAYGPKLAMMAGRNGYGAEGLAWSTLSTFGAASLIGALGAYGKKGTLLSSCCKNGFRNVLAGGMGYVLAKVIMEYAVDSWPANQIRNAAGGLMTGGMMSGMGGLGLYNTGHYPGQYPSYPALPGHAGLGSVESPEALVEGESIARQMSEVGGMGDWMTLDGLGGMGQPIPIEDIRGMGEAGGMGDWVEFDPGSPPALMPAGFPGAQSFVS